MNNDFSRLLFAVALITIFMISPVNVQAQAIHRANVEQLAETLELNDDQAEALQDIQDTYLAAYKKVRKSNKKNKEHALADLGMARANRERAILDLLSDAQKDQYLDIREEEKAKMRRRHRPGGK